jgi:hypothetical protein
MPAKAASGLGLMQGDNRCRNGFGGQARRRVATTASRRFDRINAAQNFPISAKVKRGNDDEGVTVPWQVSCPTERHTVIVSRKLKWLE